jgi:hypothetical protein
MSDCPLQGRPVKKVKTHDASRHGGLKAWRVEGMEGLWREVPVTLNSNTTAREKVK